MRELINEVNHIGTNIKQIVYNNNSGLYSETDKELLVAYMRKLNVEVNKVYEVISERKFENM
ncbi:MAG: plasmid mobilization relaxosome protein MobC [Thermoflexaceae bacterium]|nr:plasmid mobilization relaxosome protein MobC [Thermoflexaceae bacterium]